MFRKTSVITLALVLLITHTFSVTSNANQYLTEEDIIGSMRDLSQNEKNKLLNQALKHTETKLLLKHMSFLQNNIFTVR